MNYDERVKLAQVSLQAISRILINPATSKALDGLDNSEKSLYAEAQSDLFNMTRVKPSEYVPQDTLKYEAGVYAILGEQRSGKSNYAEKLLTQSYLDLEFNEIDGEEKDKKSQRLHEEVVARYYSNDEPFDSTVDNYTPNSFIYGLVSILKKIVEAKGAKDRPKIYVIDSLRNLINSLPGSYARGGISTAFKDLLTHVHNFCFATQVILIEVYTTSEDVVDSITASCCALVYVNARKYIYQYRKYPCVGEADDGEVNKRVCKAVTMPKYLPLRLPSTEKSLTLFTATDFHIRSCRMLKLAMAGIQKAVAAMMMGFSEEDVLFVARQQIYKPMDLQTTEYLFGDPREGDDEANGATNVDSSFANVKIDYNDL